MADKRPFSIRIDPALQAAAKAVAGLNGMTFEEFVALALRGALAPAFTKAVVSLERKR